MANLQLDDTGDLALSGNRLVLVCGAAEIRQRWLVAVRTVLGEWFLDQNLGVPYFDVPAPIAYRGRPITDKRLTQRGLQQIFADATRRVKGVRQVTSVTVGKIDSATRSVDVTVEATIDNGDELTFAALGLSENGDGVLVGSSTLLCGPDVVVL